MSKHTPGPWHIHDWTNSEINGVQYRGEKEGVEFYSAPGVTNHELKIVADKEYLGSSQTFGSFEGCHIASIQVAYAGNDEALANARLIAAAPEMFELIKKANELLARSKHIIERQSQIPHTIETDIETLYWKIDQMLEEHHLSTYQFISSKAEPTNQENKS